MTDWTALGPKEYNLPKSSDLNGDVSVVAADPTELIRYTEIITLAFSQGQTAVEFETRSPTTADGTEVAPTAAVFSNATVIRISVPDPTPYTRNWVTTHPLQEWEGYILDMDDKELVARLRDLTAEFSTAGASALAEEEAIIPLSEIAGEDLKRIQLGSVFRWIIGYERAATGTKKRVSHIVFRDLPAITEQDRSQGIAWARKVIQSVKE